MPRARCSNKKMPTQHLSAKELRLIDDVLRTEKGTPTDALRRVNSNRQKMGVREVGKDAVHRYVRGATHPRGAVEKRGRKRGLSQDDVRKLDQARRRLIKRARNETRVTYADIIEEAGLKSDPCQRICEDALRKIGVGFRHPRRNIYVSEVDAKKRLIFSRRYIKRPSNYWSNDVHGYVDKKAFPMPLTEQQRVRFRQTMVTGHLRKPSEGTDRHFTKPREKHSFVGLPSVTVSAAVAKDKVIMWHVIEKQWNGAAAAAMYTNHLKPALRRTWPGLSRHTIIEDGDRKGNASGKGIRAKKVAKIRAITLPPRTPSLMPLDYAIWNALVKKMIDGAPKGKEHKAAFLNRLRRNAESLPKGYIKGVIGRMKGNLQALKDAQGYTPKND